MNSNQHNGGSQRAAVIDVGTNSIKITIGEKNSDGSIRTLAESASIARLGEGVDATHRLKLEAQERAIQAITEQLKLAFSLGVEKVRLLATSAVRDAGNRDEFINQIHSRLGVDLEVLSGEEEAQLSYTAIAQDPSLGLDGASFVVADIGGGSSELAFGEKGFLQFSTSLKIGAVRLTERILQSDPPTELEISNALSLIDQTVKQAAPNRTTHHLVGVGGSAINLSRIHYKIPLDRTASVHGRTLTKSDLESLLNLLTPLTNTQKKSLIGLDPDRAEIITAGALILYQITAALQAANLTISIHGLRHAALAQLFE